MKKLIWLIVIVLLVSSLLLPSCGEATETETEGQTVQGEVTEPTEPETTTPVTTIPVTSEEEKPQYGGTLTWLGSDGQSIDPQFGFAHSFMNMVFEYLGYLDYTLPPEVWSFSDAWTPDHLKIPCLAESWEFPDDRTVIFHLKQGIYFNAGLSKARGVVGDREVTADDWAFSFSRALALPWHGEIPAPGKRSRYGIIGNLDKVESVEALDKYTFQVKYIEPQLDKLYYLCGRNSTWVIPHEIIETYGDMMDWRNHVGTGPFILTDYIPNTGLFYDKNESYWGTSATYGEEYPIPFIDGAKILFIMDRSTILAALRTAKVDWTGDVAKYLTGQDALDLQRTNPEILLSKHMSQFDNFWIKCNEPPFDDVRVRRAMYMAIDMEGIKDAVWGGLAEIAPYPISPTWTHLWVHPQDSPSELVREIWTYDPVKAKQLMADAGYPNGFKATVMMPNSSKQLDPAQVMKGMLEEIGIDLEITTGDSTAVTTLAQGDYPQDMICRVGTSSRATYNFDIMYQPEGEPRAKYNYSYQTDAEFQRDIEAMRASMDDKERDQILIGLRDYWYEQCYAIHLPQPYIFNAWQPWVKNYRGQQNIYWTYWGHGGMAKEMWIDQDLKAQMNK